eukprot:TRINITY_DN58905_c0_g1_i1.p1 TRINITY_DN58905_c0_g1~~TRINITY_DN58905_c0_g1_i1.p1  ORF type:complete len:489 (+),score=68.04 TRINITY_DN58905_c0_g1_i1:66-1469(+)
MESGNKVRTEVACSPVVGKTDGDIVDRDFQLDANKAALDAKPTLESTDPESQNLPVSDDSCTLREWFYFFVFGMGPGWVMLDSMFIELSWFQAVQPEGLKLASHMTFAGALSLVTSVPLYLACQRFLEYRFTVPGLTISSFILAAASALLWRAAIGNVSVAILLITFIGSTIGNMQVVVIMPWMSCNAKPRLVSALMSGSNFGALVAAALGLLQSPGSRKLFSPTLYYSVLCVMLTLPMFAYYRIKTKRIGMSERPRASTKTSTSLPGPTNLCSRLSNAALPSFWRRAIEPCLVNAFLQIVCWFVLRAVLPFAAANVVKGNHQNSCNDDAQAACPPAEVAGGNILEYCIEFSFLSLTIGSLASTSCKFCSSKDLRPYVCLFAFLACTVCLAAFGWPLWQHQYAGELMILTVVCMRFIDGFLSPLIFRIVSVQFSSESEAVLQWIAVVEKAASFSASAIIYVVVEVLL